MSTQPSFDQKIAHASDLRDRLGVTRPILVDSIEGDCHRTYGSMPNMTWIFNRAGLILYKSDWTDASSVENAILYYLDIAKRRRGRERLAPFKVERLDFRSKDSERFMEGLARSGPKAVQEFKDTSL